MSGNMPPEPPPVTSEADYINGPAKRTQQVSTVSVVGTAPVAFYGTDLPIPTHLLKRDATPALNKAVADILAEPTETIPKNGFNKYQNYAYATADDIRAYVAQRLGKHGLSYEQHEIGYTPFDKLIAVHYYFVLVHSSGETAPPQRVTALARMLDNSGKPDDKAFSKVCVLALKDWSKGRFSIATGDVADDPDASPEPAQPQRQAPPQQQRPAPARPPAKSPAAAQAFRNAGLPPKVAPLQNGADTDPSHIAETGELTEGWLATALHHLEHATDSRVWMAGLEEALRECPDMDSFGQISNARRVKLALDTSKLPTRQKIRSMFDEAANRLRSIVGTPEPQTEDDGWPGPTPEQVAEANAARAAAHE